MSPYYWHESKSEVPDDAVEGGSFEDQTPMYVGRSFHEGYWIPAKVDPKRGTASLAVGSYEILKNDYHILCGRGFFWAATEGSRIPRNVFIAANTSPAGGPLYVGRVEVEDDYVIGMVDQQLGYCCVAVNGNVIASNEYEILLQRN